MYTAFVTSLSNICRVPNTDRLCFAQASGYTIITACELDGAGNIVSPNSSTMGLLLPPDGQLSEEFCLKMGLLREHPVTGAKLGGYMEANRRVRAQKIRKISSEGIWLPLESLNKAGYRINQLKQGQEISELELGGTTTTFCQKYISASTKRAIERAANNPQQASPKVYPEFQQHYETGQLRFVLGVIPEDALIYISSKSHGCVDAVTLIETLEYGTKTIKEIVDRRLNCHIKGLNTQTGQVVYTPIDDWYLLEDDGEWYEIELEDGRTITITGNNPVWLPTLQAYRPVENLKIGDVLLTE